MLTKLKPQFVKKKMDVLVNLPMGSGKSLNHNNYYQSLLFVFDGLHGKGHNYCLSCLTHLWVNERLGANIKKSWNFSHHLKWNRWKIVEIDVSWGGKIGWQAKRISA